MVALGGLILGYSVPPLIVAHYVWTLYMGAE
jgi:hypothetical protein